MGKTSCGGEVGTTLCYRFAPQYTIARVGTVTVLVRDVPRDVRSLVLEENGCSYPRACVVFGFIFSGFLIFLLSDIPSYSLVHHPPLSVLLPLVT